MALDEPKETDEVIRDNGLTFLIGKALYEENRLRWIYQQRHGSGIQTDSTWRRAAAAAEGSCSAC